MTTELEINAPDPTAAFADAVNTMQMNPAQVQEVSVRPTANFNAARGTEFQTRDPKITHPSAASQNVASDIANEATAAKVTGIQTGRDLNDGISVVHDSLREGATACTSLLGGIFEGVESLKNDMVEGIQPPPPANKVEEPAQVAKIDPKSQALPENTVHTHRADLELNQPTPSYQPSMMG